MNRVVVAEAGFADKTINDFNYSVVLHNDALPSRRRLAGDRQQPASMYYGNFCGSLIMSRKKSRRDQESANRLEYDRHGIRAIPGVTVAARACRDS
jgi:hypothetical protein